MKKNVATYWKHIIEAESWLLWLRRWEPSWNSSAHVAIDQTPCGFDILCWLSKDKKTTDTKTGPKVEHWRCWNIFHHDLVTRPALWRRLTSPPYLLYFCQFLHIQGERDIPNTDITWHPAETWGCWWFVLIPTIHLEEDSRLYFGTQGDIRRVNTTPDKTGTYQ